MFDVNNMGWSSALHNVHIFMQSNFRAKTRTYANPTTSDTQFSYHHLQASSEKSILNFIFELVFHVVAPLVHINQHTHIHLYQTLKRIPRTMASASASITSSASRKRRFNVFKRNKNKGRKEEEVQLLSNVRFMH